MISRETPRAASAARFSFLAAAILVGVFSSTGEAHPSGNHDWIGFLGPEGDGSVASGHEEPAAGLSPRWQMAIGSGYSGIVVADGTLVTCASEGEHDVVLALDTADGSRRWAVELGEAMIGHGGSLDGAIATPALADGTVYVFGPYGDFVAIEVASGREIWRRDLATEDAVVPYYGFGSSPLVVGELVVVQVGGEAGAVVALERSTGEVAWRSFAGVIEAQSPKLIEVDGRSQLVVATNEVVAGLDPEEGTLLWRWPFTAQDAQTLTTSPLGVGGGRIFFTAAPNRGVLLDPTAGASRQVDGVSEPAVLWEANVLTRTYSPAVVVGDQLVGYTSRFLGGYSVATGEMLWRSREPGDGFLIAVDEQLVVITKEGSLHLADLAGPGGGWREIASEQLFDDIVWTVPSYHDDALYVRSMTEIARVDLVRADAGAAPAAADEIRVTEAATDVELPGRLRTLLEGDPAQLGSRVDELLAEVETPILDGERALFLWRGEARDVGIAGDFLGMRVEGAFRRLDGTDLWWYQTEVAPRLQYTYILYVDYEPTLDPLNPRVELSSVMGRDANWVRGEPVEMSYFAMPDWPGPPAHLRSDAPVPERRGRLAQLAVEIPEEMLEEAPEFLREELRRPFDVWLPPSYDETDRRYPTLYVYEWTGARHPGAGRWIETLDATAGRAYREPIVVFMKRLPREFLMAELVAAVDRQFRTVADREARATIGWAFAGLEAVSVAGRHADLFARLGVQSQHGFSDDIVALTESVPAASAERPFTAYLDWGSLDTRSPSEGWDMADVARGVYEGLAAKGVRVSGGEVEATSDWKSWRNRTHLMLAALFPLE